MDGEAAGTSRRGGEEDEVDREKAKVFALDCFLSLFYSKCGKQDLNPINERKMALPKRYTENSWKKKQDYLRRGPVLRATSRRGDWKRRGPAPQFVRVFWKKMCCPSLFSFLLRLPLHAFLSTLRPFRSQSNFYYIIQNGPYQANRT